MKVGFYLLPLTFISYFEQILFKAANPILDILTQKWFCLFGFSIIFLRIKIFLMTLILEDFLNMSKNLDSWLLLHFANRFAPSKLDLVFSYIIKFIRIISFEISSRKRLKIVPFIPILGPYHKIFQIILALIFFRVFLSAAGLKESLHFSIVAPVMVCIMFRIAIEVWSTRDTSGT